MKRQTRSTRGKYVAQFPILGTLIGQNYDRNVSPRVPVEIYIRVQRADEALMLKKTKHVGPMSDHFVPGNEFGKTGMRGTLVDSICAVASDHTLIRMIYWHSEKDDYSAKIVFKDVDPERVEYLVLIERYNWRTVTPEELAGKSAREFGWAIPKERTQIYTVYLKPREGFKKLLQKAEQQLVESRKS